MPDPAPSPSAPTNILLIGSGGREHALAWKLRQSPRCGQIYAVNCTNPGLLAIATAVELTIDPRNTLALQRFVVEKQIGLVVIGPEEPLAAGMADAISSTGADGGPGSIAPKVFGPSKQGAMLEADKAFAKEMMRGASVPTADSRTFTDFESAKSYLESREAAQVIKASGLAKGKGVFVPESLAEAIAALERVMVKKEFGAAGKTVVIEERLKGREVSVFALIDGQSIYMLEACQDHKRIGDGATGPNTGGMGSLCPAPAIDARTMAKVEREVLVPMLDALRRENIDYRGVLYVGLMLTPGGPKVIEFNVRFGDPECQALMRKLDGDLVGVMLATADRKLDEIDVGSTPGAAVCVVLASHGYPEKPRSGDVITGLDAAAQVEGVEVFHAGTARDAQGRIVTAGGRVLSVTAIGADRDEARARAYKAAAMIHFDGKQMRTDIGTDVVG